MKTPFLLLFFGILFCCAPICADKIYLKDGRVLEGEVTDEGGDAVSIKMKYGVLKFNRDKIDRIEQKESPKDEFSARFKTAGKNVEKLVELAQWTQSKKLKEEFQQVLEVLKEVAPKNPEVEKLLYEFEKSDKVFEDDKTREDEILNHLGPGFKVLRSQHYVIFYNSDTGFAKRRLGLFEKLYDEFYKYWEKREFELKTLPSRLVCILFDSRESYQQYATRTGGLAQAGGYWSSKTNWTYFFDTGKSADVLRVENSIEEQKKRIKEFEVQIKKPEFNNDQNKKTLQKMKQNLKKFENEFDGKVNDLNLSVTIHEATHQLCYNLGVLELHNANPSWLVEGLAVYFETGTPSGAWLGPGRKNKDYIENVSSAFKSKKIVPLKKFLTICEGFFSGGIDTTTGYSLSWCMLYFMMRNESYEQKLRLYMKDLMKLDPYTKYSDKEILDLILKHFGPMDQFQKDWESQLRRLDAIPD